MVRNPFNSHVFKTTWLKYFKKSASSVSFKVLEDISFYKKGIFPVYINVGRNITNGNFYRVNENAIDYRNKVFVIHDVPDYFDVEPPKSDTGIKVCSIKQYEGFSSNLDEFESFDDFFRAQFKSNSRYKYKRNISRLEACFDISYEIFHGNISTEEYDKICVQFKTNLQRRFQFLGKDNDIVNKWDYYYDLIYKCVCDKTGVLSVIYNGERAIGISFAFLAKPVLLYAITSFDMDYTKFNLGHTSIIKLMNWCFDNGYKVYDFSKGAYEYKDRWTNSSYNYSTHILYDKKSLPMRLLVNVIASSLKFKQFLRDKNVNSLYWKLRYLIKPKTTKKYTSYRIEEIESSPDFSGFKEVDVYGEAFDAPRGSFFNYLYGKPQGLDELKLFKSQDDSYFAYNGKSILKISPL